MNAWRSEMANICVHLTRHLCIHITTLSCGVSVHIDVMHMTTLKRLEWRWVRKLWSFPHGSDHKESACNARDPASIPGLVRSLGEGNGFPPIILAWRIPWTEEPGGLQSRGSPRMRHHWAANQGTMAVNISALYVN